MNTRCEVSCTDLGKTKPLQVEISWADKVEIYVSVGLGQSTCLKFVLTDGIPSYPFGNI